MKTIKLKPNIKKIEKRLYALLVFGALLILAAPAKADPDKLPRIAVSGKVTSLTDGSTLPGVNVLLKGTNEGTITDANGEYSINVDDENSVLIFSYIGFFSQEITVGSQTVINVEMTEDITSLDEVVVTALGIKREERSLGYAVSKVESEEVTRVAQENVLNALSGKVAGATISSTGGTGSSVTATNEVVEAEPQQRPRGQVAGVLLEPTVPLDGAAEELRLHAAGVLGTPGVGLPGGVAVVLLDPGGQVAVGVVEHVVLEVPGLAREQHGVLVDLVVARAGVAQVADAFVAADAVLEQAEIPTGVPAAALEPTPEEHEFAVEPVAIAAAVAVGRVLTGDHGLDLSGQFG
ncbi:MAG: hypothetical protein F6K42_38515, partial [Leptolyngbya sp. SIO1D8]|nr:hypothetical protein [Leptolyngbya sp. SIO1D8]